MSRYPRMNWDEHQSVGKELKHSYLLIGTVLGKYPKSSKVARSARSALRAVLALRNELDNQVGVDCQGKTDRELNSVYFGQD